MNEHEIFFYANLRILIGLLVFGIIVYIVSSIIKKQKERLKKEIDNQESENLDLLIKELEKENKK